MSEWTLQRAAYVFLCAVLPVGSEVQSNDAAGGTKKQRELNAARGCRAGWPDMTCEVDGFPGIYPEAKMPGGRLTPEQQRRGNNLLRLGRHWFVFHSLAELECELRRIGVPLRGTTLTAAERDRRLAERAVAPIVRTTKPRQPRPTRAQVAAGNRVSLAGARGA